METTTQEQRHKLINDAFIARKQGFTSLGAPLTTAFEKVNQSITEKTNTLQTRLKEVEDQLRLADLHNHYY